MDNCTACMVCALRESKYRSYIALLPRKRRRFTRRIFGHLKTNMTGSNKRGFSGSVSVGFTLPKREIAAALPLASRNTCLDRKEMIASWGGGKLLRASVQGCGFHLAQAWNRSCIALGLKKYILGPERDDRIVGWWETTRGTPFLRALPPRMRALAFNDISARRLGVLIHVDHPPLSVLIDTLRKLSFETRATLTRLQEVGS
ncbi:hypothetical protein COOONC_10586 [Cooperia oncophora]